MGLWGWEKPSSFNSIKGVAIVAHGLNLRPTRMLPLAQVLRGAGIHPVCVALSGHVDGSKSFADVSREAWLDEMLEAYALARSIADQARCPLYFLGYSLGALLGQDLLTERSDVRWDRQVLLAPATHPRTHTRLVRVFQPFGDAFAIPSLSYAGYAAQKSTAMAAYRALFESEKKLMNTSVDPLRIPTRVYIDPRDEMVSTKKIQKWIEQNKLKEWKLDTLRAQGSLPIQYRHLIIDETTLGKAAWSQLCRKILFHFKELTKETPADLTA